MGLDHGYLDRIISIIYNNLLTIARLVGVNSTSVGKAKFDKILSTFEEEILDKCERPSTSTKNEANLLGSYPYASRRTLSLSDMQHTLNHARQILSGVTELRNEKSISLGSDCFSAAEMQLQSLISCMSHATLRFSETVESSDMRDDSIDRVDEDEISTDLLTRLSNCTDACLVTVQNIEKTVDATQIGDESTTSSRNIVTSFKKSLFLSSMIKLDIIFDHLVQIKKLASLIKRRRTRDSFILLKVTRRALKIVRLVLQAYQVTIEDSISAYKSAGKLLYIVLRTFRTLQSKGFCSTEVQEEDGEGEGVGDMTFEDDVEGTGLGEGQGKKDVSDEIEDEDQLLGNRSENQDQEKETERDKLNKEEQDTGVEMSQEFDGQTFDLDEMEVIYNFDAFFDRV